MKRWSTIAAAGFLLAASLLTGCGGTEKTTGAPPPAATGAVTSAADPMTGPYCTLLKEAAKDISSLSNFDFKKFGALADDARTIRAKVPTELVQPWTTLAAAVIAMDDALDAAGTTMAALVQAAAAGKAPAGLRAKLATLQGPDIGAAAATIKAHAQTTCKVTLS